MADGTTALSFPIAAGDRLVELIWATETHVEALAQNFFMQAGMGYKVRTGGAANERRPGLPIIFRDEFKRQGGFEIRMKMRKQLARSAAHLSTVSTYTYNTTSMLGNEEALVYQDLRVYLGLMKEATGYDSPDWLSHRTSMDMEQEAQDALKDWLIENEEEAIVDTFIEKWPYFVQQCNSLTATAHPKLYYANHKTDGDSMTAEDILNEQECRRMWSYAFHKKLNPIKIGGKKCFVVLADSFILNDLLSDPNFREIVANAADRGSDNPLISGASFNFLNLYFWAYDRVRRASSGGNAANIGQLMLLGADAIAVAYGSEPRLVSRTETNYGDRFGMAIRRVFGAARCDFTADVGGSGATVNQSSAQWNVWEERDEFAS